MKKAKIYVYLLTGFLGSGKTTLLNTLLQQFSDQKNIVIENEFGKINIDTTLIKGKFESVFELTNGCICCSISNQLFETLSLIDSLPEKPNNLFIETTGIADAGEVASIFNQLYISEKFDLKKIICVVDAQNINYYIDSAVEIHKQIVASDCILINKTETIELNEIDSVKKLVKSLNPFAEIILSKDGGLLKDFLFTPNNSKIRIENTIDQTKNIHNIKSLLFETDSKFNIQQLKYELFKILYLYYHQIFRIKGYVLDTNNEVFLVQSIGKTTSITPVKNKKIEKSQLVFIGTVLEIKSIERLMKPAFEKINKKKAQLIS
ncbi:GTPase, G3E family [Flavobacterium micromati]|uniref:GTPase, G3E family n=1 Tax=Flavobacterium micromati TaxID=229205 RepID=A0A1M5KNL8_9FLAO|nr:GTP-binding protein [Flavobacterium micromati]SHG54316.1 GTPase, G3E family [Flavobacterium micromati]